jgi:hypothetical protein
MAPPAGAGGGGQSPVADPNDPWYQDHLDNAEMAQGTNPSRQLDALKLVVKISDRNVRKLFYNNSMMILTSHVGGETPMEEGEAADAATPDPAEGSEGTPDARALEMIKNLQQEDLDKARQAVARAGGFRADANKGYIPPKRRGMVTRVVNKDWDAKEFLPPVKVARPEEKSLPRLTVEELLPPPSVVPDGLECEVVSDRLVRAQNLVFLVMMRPTLGQDLPWDFPSKTTLETLFDCLRSEIESVEIIDVALSCAVDPENGIATMTLNTVNLKVFEEVRDFVRKYQGVKGFGFETYSKLSFIRNNAITAYINKSHKCFLPKRFLGFLFHKYPQLNSNVKVLHVHEFPPVVGEDLTHRQKSRVGDCIVVMQSADLLEKLKDYDESTVFHLGPRFRITLRGGQRSSAPADGGAHTVGGSPQFPAEAAEKVMKNFAQEIGEGRADSAPPPPTN